MSDPSKTVFADLKMRVIAAVIFGAVAYGFLAAGGLPLAIFATILTALMLHELTRLIAEENDLQPVPAMMLIGLGAASVLLFYFRDLWGYIAAILGIGLVAIVNPGRVGPITVAGYFIVVLSALGLLQLRMIDEGLALVLWIIASVAAADIGGYIFGRTLQGPKLWPAVSPKKTWSGFLGGMVLCLIVAVIFSMMGGGGLLVVLIAGALISVISVGGDLAESAVKRRFGVKDAGNILPGHGGLLDRLDGMTVVMIFFFALCQVVDLTEVFAPDFGQTTVGENR